MTDTTDFTSVIQQIEKKFGSGSLWQGDQPAAGDTQVISTGSRKLDRATGIGGVPRGRIIEIYGPEASGKSTLSIQLMAQAQKQGTSTAYIDAENALDPAYATRCGVDISQLLVSQPDSAEMALGIAEELAASDAVGLIVIDSVAALVPQEEIDKDLEEVTVALQARLMSRALRKIVPVASKNRAAMVFVNQIRDNINTYPGGQKTVTPGGRALKFYASLRIELRAGLQIKDRDLVIGNRVRANIRKNKLAPPFRFADLSIIYGEGFSNEIELIDDALDAGAITRRGSHYYYDGASIAMGAEKLRQTLRRDPELYAAIAARTEDAP